ncbi:coiled-coil domain-containing protein 115-like [Montipora capricornis]|uniref:coiled-coil domain-containing protein 115-like n=1 Tax=Montipora capricornis TaxID=246305 RepID=UPI0035F13146
MDDICSEIDRLTLEFFDHFEVLQEKRQYLNDAIRDGHLNLSKARYSMGNKAVGALQYSHKMDCALYHVDCSCSKEPKDSASLSFQLQKYLPGKGLESPETFINTYKQEENTLRKRVSDSNSRVGGREETAGIEELNVEKEDKLHSNRSSNGCVQDPIKWFGILVPGCLKTGQRNFQTAIELCCEVANLESKLREIIQKFNALKTRKEKLILEKSRISQESET